MCIKTNVSLKTPRIPFMHWVFCTPLSLLHTAIDTLYYLFGPIKSNIVFFKKYLCNYTVFRQKKKLQFYYHTKKNSLTVDVLVCTEGVDTRGVTINIGLRKNAQYQHNERKRYLKLSQHRDPIITFLSLNIVIHSLCKN